MKKHLFLLLIGLSALTYAQAQNTGGPHLNAGLGLDGAGIPIYASYDWHVSGDFNMGLGGSIGTGGKDYGGILGLGVFGQWYANRLLDLPTEFDAYGGAGLYYYNFKGGDDLAINLFIGGRYYFDSRMAINLELGGGTAFSGAKVGLSWRM